MKTKQTTDMVTAVLNRDVTDAQALAQARAQHAALVAVAEAAQGVLNMLPSNNSFSGQALAKALAQLTSITTKR
jgi:hypothetical protein